MVPRRSVQSQWTGVLCVAALLFGASCGGDDAGPGGEVNPSQVRHGDLATGFWVAELGPDNVVPFTEEILQFTTVEQARAMYGGLGVVHGTGGTLLQTLEQSLAFFDGDDPVVLGFSRTGGRIWTLAAVRVAAGNVGWSSLGFVGFDYGFAPPEERPIVRFVRGEELVLRRSPHDDLTHTYRWVDDCRWISDTGWRSVSAVQDGPYNPWFSVGMTRGSDVVGGFERERTDDLQMVVWQEGACPVYGRDRSLPMGAGAQFVADGDDGLIGVRRTTSGFGTLHLRPGQPLIASTEEPAMEQSPVEQLARLPDGRAVFLETDLRLDRSQQAAARWVAVPGEAATPWPLPPLPNFDDKLHVTLRRDGSSFISWAERVPRIGQVPRLQLEQADGTWKDLPLEGVTPDGIVVDLSEPDRRIGPLQVDAEERVVAIVSVEDLIAPDHVHRPWPVGARALVRMIDGEADLRLLPAGSGGRTYMTHVAEDGTWRGFGEFGPADAQGTELEIITWPVDGEVEVLRPGLVTRGNLRGLHGFWDLAWYLGTYIWHRRHLQVEDNGAVLVSDGWSTAYVRPPDALYRPRMVTIQLVMENAPPGARLESMHAPLVACETTCEVSASQGTVLGLRVESPPGWIPEGPSVCTGSYLDAGLCSVVVVPGWTCPGAVAVAEDEATDDCAPWKTYRFAWRPAAAVDMTDASLPGWWGRTVADADGEVLAVHNVASGVLPDGTEIEGGDNTNPIPVITRWQGTTLRWAAVLPQYAQVEALALAGNGDALVVVAAPDQRTLALPEREGGAEVPLPAGVRTVVRLSGDDGRLLSAPRFEMPPYFTPRAHAVTVEGALISFGRSGAPRGPGASPEDSVIPLEHELLLHHQESGALDVLYERPETRGGGEAMFALHPSGGFLFLREEDGAVHWRAFDANLALLGGSASALHIGPQRFGDLYAAPTDDGYLIGATGGPLALGNGQPDVDGDHTLLVFDLDLSGALRRTVALQNEESMRVGKVLGLTRLPDGRMAGIVRRGSSGGVEALLLEGEAPIDLGSYSTQVLQQEGFLSSGLFARPGGTLAWVTRPWQRDMVFRPYLVRSAAVFEVDPSVWADIPELTPSVGFYRP